MTINMEDNVEVPPKEKSVVSEESSPNHVIDPMAYDKSDEGQFYTRERNILLLSALFYLYGEEWKEAPDWDKVAETILAKKIPQCGMHFSAKSCELMYRSLMDDGYPIGVGDIKLITRTPKRLQESQKRLWILASTANDLVINGKSMERAVRTKCNLVKSQDLEIEAPVFAFDRLRNQCSKKMEIIKPDSCSESDLENECDNDEVYEDGVVESKAVDMTSLQLLQQTTGLKDVFVLIKYCSAAVEHAVNKLPSLTERKEQRPSADSLKSESIVEFTKNTISTNQVSQELKQLVHSAIAGTSEDDKVKITSPIATAPTLSKLLELPASSPGMPLPEIPATAKSNEPSPQKSSSRPATRASSKERTSPERTAQTNSAIEEVSLASKGEVSSSAPSTQESPKLDVSKEEPSVEITSDTEHLSPSKRAEENHVPDIIDISKDVDTGHALDNKVSVDAKGSVPKSSEEVNMEESETSTIAKTNDGHPDNSANENSAVARDSESPTKGKSSPKKGTGTTRSHSTRTSSRLTSPEPNEQVTPDEDKPGKKMGRQTSNSETHTPVLRSRRGATPTKATPVEKESVKTTSTTNITKPDATSIDDNETESPKKIEKPESPKASPDASDPHSDVEIIHDTKPKQNLRVYSAKPPSPLSHVDPKLFAEFTDEEDDELTMIDDNVNKTKDDKNSQSKSYSRKGRTTSSENVADGMYDENAQSKRLTRSSLKIHDAVNEAVTAEDNFETTHTGHDSEKAASESSFGDKEKKTRTSKSMSRLKKLNEEKQQLFGDGDSEEGGDGKRVTRARAKTGPSHPEKRTKLPSVGDSELSETEPTPNRATRSRVSTTSHMPVLELGSSQQTSATEEEDHKAFRKLAMALLNKIINHKSATSMQKYLGEDPSKILKHPMDFQTIRRKVEIGAARTFSSVHKDLAQLVSNVVFAHPNATHVKDCVTEFHSHYRTALDETKGQRNVSTLKDDSIMDSDVESLESHEEQQRGETTPKQPSGNRRKRRRSASETSTEDVFPLENKRRLTRTSASSVYQQASRKTKHPISPDIVSANRF